MNRKRMLNIGLQAAAILVIVIMASMPQAIASIHTTIKLENTQVVDAATWDPIYNANVELTCESVEDDVETVHGTTDMDGIVEVLEAEEISDDSDREGSCGISITAAEYKDFEIERDDDQRNLKWDEKGFRWTSGLTRDVPMWLATAVGTLITNKYVWVSALALGIAVYSTSFITIKAVGAAAKMKGLKLGGTALAAIKGGALALSLKTLGISLLVLAGAIIIHHYGELIYCTLKDYIWPGADGCPHTFEKDRQVFGLEPDPDQIPTPEEPEYASIPRTSWGIDSSQISGKISRMNKHQLNDHLIGTAIDLQKEEKTTQMIHVEETEYGHSDCTINPSYPNNPPQPGEKTPNGELDIKRDEFQIVPGYTYLFTMEGEQDTSREKNFKITAERIKGIDLEEEENQDELELEKVTMTMQNARGPCISRYQTSDPQERMLNQQIESSGTLTYNDTYQPTYHFKDLKEEHESVGRLDNIDEYVYCAPGDEVINQAEWDVSLVPDEVWYEDLYNKEETYPSRFEGDYTMPAKREEEISTTSAYECGEDIDGEQLYCPDGGGALNEYTCIEEEHSICLEKDKEDEVGEYCGGTNAVAHFCDEGDQCIKGTLCGPEGLDYDEEPPIQKACRVKNVTGKLPCDTYVEEETVIDVEENKYIQRAPNNFGCGEPGASQRGERGKTCPFGTIYDPMREGCMANTLYEE